MKKFYSVLLSMFAVMCIGFSAKADYTQTLIVDDPMHFVISPNPDFTKNDEWYEAELTADTTVASAEGYEITAIDCKYSASGEWSSCSIYDPFTIYVNQFNNGEYYRFTSAEEGGSGETGDAPTLVIKVPEGKTTADYINGDQGTVNNYYPYIPLAEILAPNYLKVGDWINFYAVYSNIENTTVLFNGEQVNDPQYGIKITIAAGENVLEFVQNAVSTVNLTLSVDNPDAIQVLYGSANTPLECTWDSGKTTISSEYYDYITIKPVSGSKITSVKLNNNTTVSPDTYDSQRYVIELKNYTDRDELNITTYTYVWNKAYIYVDDADAGVTWKLSQEIDGVPNTQWLEAGKLTPISYLSENNTYTLTKYYAKDVEGTPSFFFRNNVHEKASDWGYVENLPVNTGEYAHGAFVYEDYTGYLYFGDINFNNGDIVKVYYGDAAPSLLNINIIAEGAQYTVNADNVTSDVNTSYLQVLPGTELTFAPVGDTTLYGVVAKTMDSEQTVIGTGVNDGANYTYRPRQSALMYLTTQDPAANNFTLTIDNLDNISKVTSDYEGNDIILPTGGSNTFVFDIPGSATQASPYVWAKDGCIILSATSVTDKGTDNEKTSDINIYNPLSQNFYLTNQNGNVSNNITVTTGNLLALRTAAFWLSIDDAENVSMVRSFTNQAVNLNPENDPDHIYFIPEKENNIVLTTTDGSLIYKVTVNDEAVTASYGTYSFSVNDGDNVVITKNFPEVNVPVNLSFTNEGTENFITKFYVDGEEVAPEVYGAEGYTVKLGSTIKIEGSYDYKFISFSVNDEVLSSSYWYGYQEFTVMSEDAVNIVINVAEYTYKTVTFEIADASYIKVYSGQYGYQYESSLLTLDENNQVKVREDVTYLSVKKNNPDIIFDSVKVGTTYMSTNIDGVYMINPVTDGMTVTIATTAVAYDDTMIVYFDGPTKIDHSTYHGYEFKVNGKTIELTDGYNEIPTSAGYSGSFSIYGNPTDNDVPTRYFYVNNEWQETNSTYYFTADPKTVVKMFLTSEEPVMSTVAITLDNTAKMPIVTMDRILEVHSTSIMDEDATESKTTLTHGFEALNGTEVCINPNGNTYQKVEVNGTEVTANTDGNYVVTIQNDDEDEPVMINITADEQTGINGIGADVLEGTVYNLQGIRINSEVRDLKPGVYVINGKKTLVK